MSNAQNSYNMHSKLLNFQILCVPKLSLLGCLLFLKTIVRVWESFYTESNLRDALNAFVCDKLVQFLIRMCTQSLQVYMRKTTHVCTRVIIYTYKSCYALIYIFMMLELYYYGVEKEIPHCKIILCNLYGVDSTKDDNFINSPYF